MPRLFRSLTPLVLGIPRLVLALGAVALLAAGAAAGLQLRINWTASVPLGLYQLRPLTRLERGALVVTCLPVHTALRGKARDYLLAGDCRGGVTPILKPIFALPGDTVVVRPEGVERNGVLVPDTAPRTTDRHGRPLSPLFGHHKVAPGRVWVLSSYDPDSWDSRYYGPLHLADLTSGAQPLLVSR